MLTAVAPTSLQAFRGGKVSLTGSKFTNALAVDVGPRTLKTSEFTVVSDTSITFSSPTSLSLGAAQVSVSDANGKSNELPVSFVPTNPPKLDANPTVLPNQLMLWEFGGQPGHLWFLTAAPTPTTVPFLGFQWLQIPTLLSSGKLGSSGYDFSAVVTPPSVMLGLKFYSQTVMVDGAAARFSGTTNVTTTEIK